MPVGDAAPLKRGEESARKGMTPAMSAAGEYVNRATGSVDIRGRSPPTPLRIAKECPVMNVQRAQATQQKSDSEGEASETRLGVVHATR